MIASIKSYFNVIIGAIVVSFLAYMKYLKMSNEFQKETIVRLKDEIKINKKVAKNEAKRKVFERLQKERSEKLKENEITLDKIEKEIVNEIKINSLSGNDYFIAGV